jgi:O-antigen/teichoic acid export membrane protein
MNNRINSLKGIVWASVSVLIAKIGSALTQFIAAWYVIPEEFGIYAKVYSIAAIFIALKNGNLLSFLLHKDEESRSAFYLFCKLLNCIIFIILVLISIFIFSNEIEQLICIILAIYIMLSVYGLKARLKLSDMGEYSELGRLESYCAMVQCLFSITSLFLGLGIVSLAIGFASISIFELLYGNIKFKTIKVFTNSSLLNLKENIYKNWNPILLAISSAIVLGFSMNGDYIAISLNASETDLGIYFFSFQLTAATSQLLSSSIRGVITPTLQKMKEKKYLMEKEYFYYSSKLQFFSFIFCGLGIIFSGPCISMFWSNKWDLCIPIVNLLLISLSTRFQLVLVYSALDALSEWSLKFKILLIDAICLFTVSLLSSFFGGLFEITLAISCYRLLSVFIFGFLTNKSFLYRSIFSSYDIVLGVLIIYFLNKYFNLYFNFHGVLSKIIFEMVVFLMLLTIFYGKNKLKNHGD